MSDEFPPLETLIKQVKQAGYRINNLFHRLDGLWQANLRRADGVLFFEFAYGGNANEALSKALAKAKGGKTVERTHPRDDERDPAAVGSTKEPTAPPADDIDDLLG